MVTQMVYPARRGLRWRFAWEMASGPVAHAQSKREGVIKKVTWMLLATKQLTSRVKTINPLKWPEISITWFMVFSLLAFRCNTKTLKENCDTLSLMPVLMHGHFTVKGCYKNFQVTFRSSMTSIRHKSGLLKKSGAIE